MNKTIKAIRSLMLGCFLAAHFTLGGFVLAVALILIWLFT